jgi:hypothetical protein
MIERPALIVFSNLPLFEERTPRQGFRGACQRAGDRDEHLHHEDH